MRKRTSFYLLLISLVLPGELTAQVRSLGLDEALSLAAENNTMIKQAKASEISARSSYRMTNSVFLPDLSASHTAIVTNDPLSAFGFKLKQESVTASDFDPARLNDPADIENYSTRVEIRQPLLNLDGIYFRKAAKSQYEAASLQTVRTGKNIRFEVKKAYYLLELAGSAVNVLEQSVKVAEEALRITQDNEKQGFVKQADVLEASVRLEERRNQLLEAKNQKVSANEYLAYLLGLDPEEQIEPTDSLVQSPVRLFAQLQTGGIENRSDLKAFQKQIEAGNNMLKAQRMTILPRLNAFGSYEWNDHKLLGTAANNYMLGASLSWNLFGGYKNIGNIELASARLDETRFKYQNYLSQSQLQLNNTKRELELNYQQIQSGKLAKEQANESLRIRTNRFKQGLEKTTDLLMVEALASKKELEYIQAIYNYQQAVFKMELLLEKEINN